MSNILKHDLHGVPSGEIYPRLFPAGTECPPELLNAARSINALKTKDIKAAPETKGGQNDNKRTSKVPSKT